MTKIQSIKRALFTSIVSTVLCIAMLVGTTYAWFTDQVTSEGNVIQTGTLDIALEKWDAKNGGWVDATKTPIFNYSKWEPGYTEVVNLRVVNYGTLALKWSATITTEKELTALSDVINVYVRSDDQNDTVKDYISGVSNRDFDSLVAQGQFEKFTLREFVESMTMMTQGELLSGQASYLGIVLQMDPDAGNEYQGMDIGGTFDLKIIATQLTHEYDSFDNQYDANLNLPDYFYIETVEDLEDAFTLGGQGTVVNDLDGVYADLESGKELTLNLGGHDLTGSGDDYVFVNHGVMYLTGDGTLVSNLNGSIENWGTLVVNNVNVSVSGTKYGFHCKDGEVIINDLTVRAERGGLNVQGGKVTVNGASVVTTSYQTKIGYLVYAASNTSAEVIINGGEFRYEPGYYRHGVLYAGQNATIIVNGGTFGKGGSNTAKTAWITAANGGEVIIYGGRFEFDPSEFVADGYQAVKGTDGWWTVSPV